MPAAVRFVAAHARYGAATQTSVSPSNLHIQCVRAFPACCMEPMDTLISSSYPTSLQHAHKCFGKVVVQMCLPASGEQFLSRPHSSSMADCCGLVNCIWGFRLPGGTARLITSCGAKYGGQNKTL